MTQTPNSQGDITQQTPVTLEACTRSLAEERAAHKETQAALLRLQELFVQEPAFICILRGKEYVYEFANPNYLQLIGRRDVIGKPIREALPELKGQSFLDMLDQVYNTGEPIVRKERPARIDRNNDGKLEGGYFNFIYLPTHNSQGEVDGIMVHGVEITELVWARETIKHDQRRLQLSQRAGGVGTFEWHIPSNRILWTPELEALYGLQPNDFDGNYEAWRQRVHPEDLPLVESNLRQAVNGGSAYNIEFRVIWPDGSTHWVQGKGEVTQYDEQNQPVFMIGVNFDITELKQSEEQLAAMYRNVQELNTTLEERVNQRTEILNRLNTELERSNQELQEFAYVASHDLQEPLRKIQAFGNLLQEEYAEGLGDGTEYLERMRNAAGRMRVLIDDLLTFSRVSTRGLPFTNIDLTPILHQVVDDLEPRLQATGGEIELVNLPTLEADAGQMYQLFQNLLGNALKFHKPGVPPRVKVWSEVAAPTAELQICEIFVQDNGIGFDEKYLDRIFTVFQRLHGRGDYEGTGIGLAVVRKIVGRHGGFVTARSVVGEGATFIVTLPLTQLQMKETEE